MFRNNHTLQELREAASLIDSHSYILQSRFNIEPLKTPRSPEIHYYKQVKADQDKTRIAQTIKEYINRNK